MFHLFLCLSSFAVSEEHSAVSGNPVFPDLYIDQLIDHENPDLGTFPQLYYIMKRYMLPNHPIIIKIGDPVAELDPAGTSDFIVEIAHKYRGTTLTLQHRYFGKSFPFTNTTTESLKYLTVEQAIEDIIAFKKHYELQREIPQNTSWILVGGSYSGMLAAATMKAHPGEFSAAISASGLILASDDFKDYDLAVAISMGQECASAVRRTRFEIDNMLKGPSASILKTMFGAEDVEDEYMPYVISQILSLPVQNGHPEQVCAPILSAILRKDDPITALAQFARTKFQELYGKISKYGDKYLTQTGADYDSAERAWLWLRCNQLGYWETSSERSGIFSPLVTKNMFEQKCKRVFGDSIRPPNVDAFNKKYGGLSIDAKHVYYMTESQDPWMTASVTPDSGFPHDSFAYTVTDSRGAHCSELEAPADSDSKDLTKARNHLLTLLGQWMEETK